MKKLKYFLAPFSNEQILEMITKIGADIQQAFDEIEKAAQKSTAHRRLFVRGLSWDLDRETFQAAFEEFGEVEESNLVMDKATGKTKGYGFIQFKNIDSAYTALAQGTAQVEGRQVFLSLAGMKTNPAQPEPTATTDDTLRKIFVRGLIREHTVDDLRQIFEDYGTIEEAKLTIDKATGLHRGFGFVTFVHAADATAALEQPQKEYNGRTIHCNLAALGEKQKQAAAAPTPGLLNPPVPQQTYAQATAFAAQQQHTQRQQEAAQQLLAAQQQAYSNFGASSGVTNPLSGISAAFAQGASQSTFGQGLPSNPYGQAAASNPYGQPSSSGGYGQSSHPYNQPSTPGLFGQGAAANGFGQPAPSPYGQNTISAPHGQGTAQGFNQGAFGQSGAGAPPFSPFGTANQNWGR